ncbi:hypothetical protein ACXR2U_16360 [Jatrophihabitans sp. YIM 134969]
MRDATSLRKQKRVLRPAQPYFIDGLEKWEGVITQVYARNFSAKMSRPEDFTVVEAEFDLHLISDLDADRIKPGSRFYFTVRTVVNSRGRPARTASVVMQWPGRWTAEEIVARDERARSLAATLAAAMGD